MNKKQSFKKNIIERKQHNLIVKLLSLTLAFFIILSSILAFNLYNNSVPSETVSTDSSESSSENLNILQSKSEVLATAEVLLNAALKYDGDLSIDERLEALDNGDTSVVDTETLDKLVSYDSNFEENLKTTVYQVLIKLTDTLDTDDDGVVNTVTSSLDNIYLDSDAKLSYVPLSYFSSGAPSFSMEMVYVNGEWKFAPYNLIELVYFSSNLTSASSN